MREPEARPEGAASPSRPGRTRLLLPATLVLAAALPGAGPTSTGPEPPPPDPLPATVEGRVVLGQASSAPPPRLSPYARRRYRPPTARARNDISPTDVVVFLAGPGESGAPGAAPESAVITQRDRTIIPHVTAVRTGARIDFPNEDDIFHNLFSLSDPHPFNLGRYPPGDSRSEVFDEPGIIRMFCDIHSEMTAVIRVLDTPHFTRPDLDGSFRLDGIPDGRQAIVAWHPDLGADTLEITAEAAAGEPLLFRLGM